MNPQDLTDITSNADLKAFLTQAEGCRLNAYADGGGILTIGIGHTQGVYKGEIWTQDDVDYNFSKDVQIAVKRLTSFVKPENIDTVGQLICLIDCAFNLSNSFPRHCEHFNHSKEEFLNILPQYCHDSKMNVEAGLVKRRKADVMFFEGNSWGTIKAELYS